MAFTSTAAATVTNRPNDSWKAQGFLNFYLPDKKGGRRKLGAIPLKDSKPNEKALMDWLNEDPARIQVIINKIEMEYQAVEPAEGSGFDLG